MTDPAGEARREAVALRGEFVRAVVEHVGPRPASERLMIRLPTMLVIAALCGLGAVVAGLFWHLIRPATAAGGSAAASAKVDYRAVAGWDCTSANDHRFDVRGRTPDWRTVLSGGWDGDGCHGSFESISMTGEAGKDDPNQYARWSFAPSSGNLCQVDVFVPAVADGSPDAAATAAHFTVAGAQTPVYAEFVIDQSQHRGQWVTAGAYPVKDGTLVIQITDRGVPQKAGDRIAVSQARVQCSAS